MGRWGKQILERFLSNAVNKIDAKGRVSVPAHFRTVLAVRKLTNLYALQAIDTPAINAGGMDLLEKLEAKLETTDPFLTEADDLSFYIHGDGAFLKLDSDGRITVSDFIRQHTGITDQVTFVGRGSFFQLWAPDKLAIYRAEALERLAKRRAVVSG